LAIEPVTQGKCAGHNLATPLAIEPTLELAIGQKLLLKEWTVPGREGRKKQLQEVGRWEEFKYMRDRQRREELTLLWEAELDRVLAQEGGELSPGARDYLVARLVESNRKPSLASAREQLERAGMRDEYKEWKAGRQEGEGADATG
jgi:hypothetical protein